MFEPVFAITLKIANTLIGIEALRQEINYLPLSSAMLAHLRETARVATIHYSTMIEGNQLTEKEIAQVLKDGRHHRSEREEKEVLGYYAALEKVEQLALQQTPFTKHNLSLLHALAMGGGKRSVRPTTYRDGQNVIRDSSSKEIIYLPPEASDVPLLMNDLIEWLQNSDEELPCPLRAAIAHYQYTTVHPYYDGNGRTARLLATLITQKGGYGLKGIFSLDEYYARDLNAYYNALSVGPSHNYYFGRVGTDITLWIDYFCSGMLNSFKKVRDQALKAHKQGITDLSIELKKLDPRQRRVLVLFEQATEITSKDVEKLFMCRPRTARGLCKQWVMQEFVVVGNPSKKTRSYCLSPLLKKFVF